MKKVQSKKIVSTENSKVEKFSNLEKMNVSNLSKLANLEIHETSKNAINSDGKKSFYNYSSKEMIELITKKKKLSSVRQYLRKELLKQIQPTLTAFRKYQLNKNAENENVVKKEIAQFRKYAEKFYCNFKSVNVYDFRSESSLLTALNLNSETNEYKDAKNIYAFFEIAKAIEK
jgi:hypothetical protein